MLQKYLNAFLVAFICGVGVASFLPESFFGYQFYIFTVAILFIIAAVFVRWYVGSRQRLFAFFGCLAILGLGLWLYGFSLLVPTMDHVVNFAEQKIALSGRVVAEPELRQNERRYVVSDLKFAVGPRKLDGNILIVAPNYPELLFGDVVSFKCRLKRAQKIEDFNYDRYLAKSDIYVLCYQPVFEKINRGDFKTRTEILNYIYSKIYFYKNLIRNLYIENLGQNESSLANGIMLGDQKIMDTTLRQNYASSGLAHIIAISGMNMTLISGFILLVLIWLGLWRRTAFYVSMIILWVYTAMIGMPASAVRASIMSSIILAGLAFGRLASTERVILIVASLMIALNPLILRDDIGFQLSFMAFLGVVYFYEPILEWFQIKVWLRRWPNFIIEGLAMTLAAQVLSWPIMINNFGQISFISPFVNILAVPLLAPLMILLFLVLPVYYFSTSMGCVLFMLIDFLLKYLNFLATFFGGQSWSILRFDGLGLSLTFVYYCFILYVVKRRKINSI
ncbi:MAG: ComEC/Rec2 family competence protein [bacterium]